VDFDSYGTHAVAELIKHFLECLPEPLIPKSLYSQLVASSGMLAAQLLFLWGFHGTHILDFPTDIQCRNFKVNAVHQYLSQLSINARELLRRLCSFLTLYIKHSAHNKTTIGKLSGIFGPLVLRPTEEEGYCLLAPPAFSPHHLHTHTNEILQKTCIHPKKMKIQGLIVHPAHLVAHQEVQTTLAEARASGAVMKSVTHTLGFASLLLTGNVRARSSCSSLNMRRSSSRCH
jgi:hypothetical protein